MLIANNDEKEVEEIVAEANQIVTEADNEVKVEIKIVKEKVDEPIDDISSATFAESDDEKEKYRMCNCTKFNREESKLIEALYEELNEFTFHKRLEDRALYKFYGIKMMIKLSTSEI